MGLGSPEAGAEFAARTKFPADALYAEPTSACHKALRFDAGALPDSDVSGYAKATLMLAGIGSPGTMQVRVCVHAAARLMSKFDAPALPWLGNLLWVAHGWCAGAPSVCLGTGPCIPSVAGAVCRSGRSAHRARACSARVSACGSKHNPCTCAGGAAGLHRGQELKADFPRGVLLGLRVWHRRQGLPAAV